MAVLEDRVSAKPGRMLVKPESGAEFYATLEMADEPVTPGNKLNRQNVIDTLLPMSENGGVGTVIYSAVQNVDDRWLECDGSEVLAAEHPELAEVLPSVPLTLAGVKTITIDSSFVAYRMKRVNGYYIALGSGKIAYSQTTDGPWQIVSVGTTYIYDIIYANGYWVLYTWQGGGNKNYGYIYYATELGGEWTLGYNCGTRGADDGRLFFHNSQFIAVCANSYDGYVNVYTATNLSSWTRATEFAGGRMRGFAYSTKRGRWEVGLTGSSQIVIAYSTDLINWTRSEAYTLGDLQTDVPDFASVTAFNPYWAYLGVGEECWNFMCQVTGAASTYNCISFYPDGTFATYTPFDVSGYPMGMCVGDGELAVYSYDIFLRSTPTGEFVKIDNTALSSAMYGPPRLQPLPMENGEMFVGQMYSSSGGTGVVHALHGVYLKYRPEITVPDATGVTKAYIKAK